MRLLEKGVKETFGGKVQNIGVSSKHGRVFMEFPPHLNHKQIASILEEAAAMFKSPDLEDRDIF